MEALTTGYGLLEGPVWDADEGLYFSDVPNGGVYRISLSDDVSLAIPHRRGIGGMALHEAGGLVVGGRNVAYKSLDGEQTVVLMDNDLTHAGIGFNDLTTDAQGRIYVGSLGFRVFSGDAPKAGHLHVIDLDGSIRTISDGVMLTNGMGFSPNDKLLYHSDARENHVRVYDVHDDGSVSPWRIFAEVDGEVPDGMAVAEDGSVWVALAEGGCVVVYEPDGTERMRLPVPLPMVTSVCFGGADLRDLYIVTGTRGGPSDTCGTVYRTRVDVPGLPLAPCRVALS